MNLVIQPSWQTKSSLRLLRGGCHLVHLYAKTPTYGVLILIIYRKNDGDDHLCRANDFEAFLQGLKENKSMARHLSQNANPFWGGLHSISWQSL